MKQQPEHKPWTKKQWEGEDSGYIEPLGVTFIAVIGVLVLLNIAYVCFHYLSI